MSTQTEPPTSITNYKAKVAIAAERPNSWHDRTPFLRSVARSPGMAGSLDGQGAVRSSPRTTMRDLAAALTIAAFLAGGCASVHRTSGPPYACTTVPSVTGTWRSYRLSQVGPVWMTMTLRCDCTSRVTSQLLFMRYTEESYYRIESGTIVFTRLNSETEWPIAFRSGQMVVTESPTEQYPYERVSSERCP